MPIVGTSITSAILVAGPTLRGAVWVQMASAIGSAVATWAKSKTNVLLLGSVNGTVGGGQVVGKFSMAPVPLPVSSAVAAVGLLGPVAPQMASAVGLGVGTALNASAGYRGPAIGAIGADVSKVTFSNAATLIALLASNFAARQVRGPIAAQLAIGLGNGIATMVLTGSGTGVAVGVPGPSPGTGVSRSGLF